MKVSVYRSISTCQLFHLHCTVLHKAIAVQDIKSADWSQEVAPFWGAVIKSALSTEGFSGLFRAGWTTIKVHGCIASNPFLMPAICREASEVLLPVQCALMDAGNNLHHANTS